MEMQSSFGGKTMKTTIYIKMDAPDELLLSEGVCSQLDIVTYHPSILKQKAKTLKPKRPPSSVCLVQSLRLPSGRSAIVPVQIKGQFHQSSQAMLVEGHQASEIETGVVVEDAILPNTEDGFTSIVVLNYSGMTRSIPLGTVLGAAEAVEVMSETQHEPIDAVNVRKLSLVEEDGERKSY